MRIAALYDIHGNLPALDAALDDVRRAGVDRIVVGGDVVPGPMVRETIARLRSLDLPVEFLYGNCEVAVLAEHAGRDSGYRLPPDALATIRWTTQQLDDAELAFLAAWPKTVRLGVPGIGDVLFCHGTPRNENEIFTDRTPDDRLRDIFAAVDAALVVCGHTHIQSDRTLGSTRIVNAGSVGMPFQEPGAYWLLIGPGIALRRVSYDLESAAARIRTTRYPQAEEFASRYVLNPPSAREMLDLYASITGDQAGTAEPQPARG